MNAPRQIIADAWHITQTENGLWRWGFFSSFLETLLSAKLILTQIYFWYFTLQGVEAGYWDIEIWLYENVHPVLFWSLMVALGILLLMEFFLPHLCRGAIIGLAAKAYQKEETRGGLVLGMVNFFAMFTLHEIFILSGIATLISVASFVLRYIEAPLSYTIVGGAILFFVISNTLKFIASFAEEAVVVRKESIFQSVGTSIKLIFSNVSHIVFLLILLVVIMMRTVINALTLLLIPLLMIGIVVFLSSFLSIELSIVFAGIIGLGLVFGASYFFAYLSIFTQTVWTITYMELSKKKAVDVIVE